jgi:hypothetical protein
VTIPTATGDGPVVAWRTAWTAALDELELDLVRAEALLARDHSLRDVTAEDLLRGVAWTPPVGLPPLPVELAQRARAVLARQTAAAAALAVGMAANRRQAMLTTRMSAETGASPAYLDHSV